MVTRKSLLTSARILANTASRPSPSSPTEMATSRVRFALDFRVEICEPLPTGINTVRVEWTKDSSNAWKMREVPGSEQCAFDTISVYCRVADAFAVFEADLVFLALGFIGAEEAAIKQLGIEQDARTNIKTPKGRYSTNVPGVFASGDCRRGQSLIVWGIQARYFSYVSHTSADDPRRRAEQQQPTWTSTSSTKRLDCPSLARSSAATSLDRCCRRLTKFKFRHRRIPGHVSRKKLKGRSCQGVQSVCRSLITLYASCIGEAEN